MTARWIGIVFVGAILSLPADASVRTWRVIGTVESVIGTESLLPLPAVVGDEYILDFSYDSAAVNLSVLPDFGQYPILSLSVSIASSTLEFIDGMGGQGFVTIQANMVDPNLWGVHACLGTCSSGTTDEARFNLFFPPNTILSNALTDPPDPAGATVQFGQFSRDFPAPEEAFVVATLTSVPEPGQALLLLVGAGFLASGAALRSRAARNASPCVLRRGA